MTSMNKGIIGLGLTAILGGVTGHLMSKRNEREEDKVRETILDPLWAKALEEDKADEEELEVARKEIESRVSNEQIKEIMLRQLELIREHVSYMQKMKMDDEEFKKKAVKLKVEVKRRMQG